MAYKLIILLFLMLNNSYSAKLFCRASSNNIFIKSTDLELNVDDFSFSSDEANPAWINCNLFVDSLFSNGTIRIKYKPLYNLTSARLLSDKIVEKCIDFKYCRLNFSSLLSRPKILLKFISKRYAGLKKRFTSGKNYLVENRLLDFSQFDTTVLQNVMSPVDLAFNKDSTLKTISTMTFDSDALQRIIIWAKKNPNKKLDLYFAAQLQFLIEKVDLSLLDKYTNVVIHPIFFSKSLPNSFHLKSILKEESLILFTINFKKSDFLLNDMYIEVKSSKVNETINKILSSIDYINCKEIEGSEFFMSHFPKYKVMYGNYLQHCSQLKEIKLVSSRLSLELLDESKKYDMFTHILHPYAVNKFPNSKFYTSKLSIKDSFKNVYFNNRNHYKFIVGDNCIYYSSSNLTPTAFGNISEFAFKNCETNFFNKVKAFSDLIKKDYKGQDVLKI